MDSHLLLIVNEVTLFTIKKKVGAFSMKMEIRKVKDEVRIKQWMAIINECNSSDMPVKEWLKMNNINQATYYRWLKKVRESILENSDNFSNEIVELPSYSHKPVESNKIQSCVTLYKGETKIEIPYDCPEYMVALLMKQLC